MEIIMHFCIVCCAHATVMIGNLITLTKSWILITFRFDSYPNYIFTKSVNQTGAQSTGRAGWSGKAKKKKQKKIVELSSKQCNYKDKSELDSPLKIYWIMEINYGIAKRTSSCNRQLEERNSSKIVVDEEKMHFTSCNKQNLRLFH